MPAFLSDEWLARLDEAARASGVRGEPLTIEHCIHPGNGAPDPEPVRYHVSIDRSGARVRAGSAQAATVIFEHDRETARAIAAGELRAQRAVIEGRVTVSGDVMALIDRRDDLGRLDEAFAAISGETEH